MNVQILQVYHTYPRTGDPNDIQGSSGKPHQDIYWLGMILGEENPNITQLAKDSHYSQ